MKLTGCLCATATVIGDPIGLGYRRGESRAYLCEATPRPVRSPWMPTLPRLQVYGILWETSD